MTLAERIKVTQPAPKPQQPVSAWVKRAQEHRLPAKDMTR